MGILVETVDYLYPIVIDPVAWFALVVTLAVFWTPIQVAMGTYKPPLAKNKKYQKMDYWDERCKTHSEEQEWFVPYEAVAAANILNPGVVSIKGLKVLEVGCGTSSFSEDMFQASARKADITSIDYAEAAIKLQQKKYPERAHTCEWPGS